MRRLSLVRITAILIAALCFSAEGQNPGNKQAQLEETKGMPPRAAPGDYQAHAQAGQVTVAAEFLGHSVPRQEGPLSTDDYVVVETGFFGAPTQRLKLSTDDFSLRINGKKRPLPSQPFELVASSLKDPSWIPPDAPEAKSKTSFGSGGQGDSGPPPPVHVPFELRRAMALHLRRISLPEGDRALPQAGLIFFQYRGNSRSIHSIELTYAGPAGKVTVNLQP